MFSEPMLDTLTAAVAEASRLGNCTCALAPIRGVASAVDDHPDLTAANAALFQDLVRVGRVDDESLDHPQVFVRRLLMDDGQVLGFHPGTSKWFLIHPGSGAVVAGASLAQVLATGGEEVPPEPHAK